MKKKLQVLSISLALTSATGILHAEGNINAGKQKAESCASCHGDRKSNAVFSMAAGHKKAPAGLGSRNRFGLVSQT